MLRGALVALHCAFFRCCSKPALKAAQSMRMRAPREQIIYTACKTRVCMPVASHDAEIVADNLLNGNRRTPNYEEVPSVAFTIPPLATVGLTEDQARTRQLKFRTHHQHAEGWFRARHLGETVYGFKVLIEEGTNKILGAHLVGPGVEEVINVFAVAVRHGLTAEALKSTVFAYPTGGSDIGYML